jgi:hypothetical protein
MCKAGPLLFYIKVIECCSASKVSHNIWSNCPGNVPKGPKMYYPGAKDPCLKQFVFCPCGHTGVVVVPAPCSPRLTLPLCCDLRVTVATQVPWAPQERRAPPGHPVQWAPPGSRETEESLWVPGGAHPLHSMQWSCTQTRSTVQWGTSHYQGELHRKDSRTPISEYRKSHPVHEIRLLYFRSFRFYSTVEKNRDNAWIVTFFYVIVE